MMDDNAECFEDIISNLPEALISHILSFLTTKDAVRTSVLSTKWIYLWTTVTTLHFDDRLTYSHKRTRTSNFMNFVERVLFLGNPTIRNFHLSCSIEYDASRVHSWISDVLRRNVQKLDINYNYPWGMSLVFPRCLYGSDSLTELKLQISCTLNFPASICFASLKILQLYQVTLLNECFPQSNEIRFSFPLLEMLSLRQCKWQKVKVVTVDAPKLKHFTFYNYERMSDFAVKIHGSSLKKINCGGYAFVDITLPSPSSVVDATLQLFNGRSDYKLEMGLLTCTLLRQLSSLKYLTMSSQTVEALSHVEDLHGHLPTINNLIHLTISRGTPVLGRTFVALLQSLPVLDSLVFTWGISRFKNGDVAQEVVPSCFQTHLKVVKFQDFRGKEHEFELAKFLLANAKVLEKMTITAGGCWVYCPESEIEAVKEQLLAYPRGSDHASVSLLILSDYDRSLLQRASQQAMFD